MQDIRPLPDIVVDCGTPKYHNSDGRSSTMIDFRTFRIVRCGVCFDAIEGIFRNEFGIASQ